MFKNKKINFHSMVIMRFMEKFSQIISEIILKRVVNIKTKGYTRLLGHYPQINGHAI